mgnify:CR=1 FL=1
MKKIKLSKEEIRNPYDPPKIDETQEYDRYLETIKNREDTDWAGFFFAIIIMVIVLFQPILIELFTEMFKKL